VDGQSFGQFFITQEGNLRLKDVTLRNGNRGSGSAIYVEQGHLHVTNVVFSNNTINLDDVSLWQGGGAIFNDSGRVMILDQSEFVGNGANSFGGGAIWNKNGYLHVEDSEFIENTTINVGGAIHIERDDPEAGHEGVLIYDSAFIRNEADMGGAIAAQGENTILYIEGSSFGYNYASVLGGAIFLSNSSLTLSMDSFEYNHANDGGAVFNHEGSLLTINNSQFHGNIADTYGGGVLNAWGDVEINNCTFSANQADRGGGIFSADPVVINQSLIENNTAEYGGGMYLQERFGQWCEDSELACATGNAEPQATVTESTIQFNTAAERGGGVIAFGDLEVLKCTVYSNSSGVYTGGGGGIHFSNGHFRLVNSTITTNTGEGVTLHLEGSSGNDNSAEILHSTIAYNITSGGVGGSPGSGLTTIHNTIVAENDPVDCDFVAGQGSMTVTGENLDTDGSCENFSRPNDNPQLDTLADNGGPTETHALQPGSIAIDLAPECGGLSEDQRGVHRMQGDGCDIGAYESLTVEAASEPRCALFPNLDMSAVLLDIPPGSSALTLYVRMPGGVPGLEVPVPGDQVPWDYTASLGNTQASECSYQGYAARLYCTFDLPSTSIGSVLPLHVYVNGCDEPIFSDLNVSVFAVFPSEDKSAEPADKPGVACSAGLGAGECAEAGGSYSCGGASTCSCVCP
jgi:hypothetical protein